MRLNNFELFVTMHWIPIVIGLAVIIAFYMLKNTGSITTEMAREHIKSGAKVIDVRSPEEYREGHLPGVINIPSNVLESEIGRLAPDKNCVLLLHCLSGGRSGMATHTLKRLGYKQVFNLGSYAQAQSILTGSK